jgi:hypothetical protein
MECVRKANGRERAERIVNKKLRSYHVKDTLVDESRLWTGKRRKKRTMRKIFKPAGYRMTDDEIEIFDANMVSNMIPTSTIHCMKTNSRG